MKIIFICLINSKVFLNYYILFVAVFMCIDDDYELNGEYCSSCGIEVKQNAFGEFFCPDCEPELADNDFDSDE